LEERDLLRMFGATYRAYQQRVPKLIPLLRWRGTARPHPHTQGNKSARSWSADRRSIAANMGIQLWGASRAAAPHAAKWGNHRTLGQSEAHMRSLQHFGVRWTKPQEWNGCQAQRSKLQEHKLITQQTAFWWSRPCLEAIWHLVPGQRSL